MDAAVEETTAGQIKIGLPLYSIADVEKHKTKESRIWVRVCNEKKLKIKKKINKKKK